MRRGEIVGVAGLVGSGKAELGIALGGAIPCTGERRRRTGAVRLGDAALDAAGGLGFVPDDRKRWRMLPDAQRRRRTSRSPGSSRISSRASSNARGSAAWSATRSSASASGPRRDAPITTLSGGNQQKVVVGRCFALGVDVLVLSEPTRGIDVGAKSEIYRLIQETAEAGAGVVMISSELPELLGIADRIVMFRAEIGASSPRTRSRRTSRTSP